MKRALLVIMFCALYAVHQDFWFWRAATPLVFGFIPVGLFYHACYTVAVALAIWLLVRHAWPSHLDEGGSDVIPRTDSTTEGTNSEVGLRLKSEAPEGEH